MKKVNELGVIKWVDDDTLECSVCGKYQPAEDYRNEGDQVQRRTNCKSCYYLPYGDMLALGNEIKLIQNSVEYKKAQKKLNSIIALLEGTVYVEDLIASLQKLPNGSLMKIDGNTSAYLYTTHELLSKVDDEMKVYSIGYADRSW